MYIVSKHAAASVIHEDYMHLAAWSRLTKMRREGCCRLSSSTSGKKPVEDCQRFIVWNNLFYTYCSYMELRYRCGHIHIAFICTYDDFTSVCYTKVGTCKTSICCKKLISKALAGTISQIGRIAVAFLAA